MAKGKTKIKTLKVKSADGRVFWEKHAAHPDGEVFVGGEGAVKVAKTPNVVRAMRAGRLEEVKAGGSTATGG